MNAIDREGVFRAIIEEYGLKQVDSGSVAVAIRCKLTEWWDQANGLWMPWSEYEMEAEGDVWIVKKDGSVNEKAAESLMRHADWDGDIESIMSNKWQPTPIQVQINRDVYKDQVRFKIAFVNNHDRTPGAMSNVRPDQAALLSNKYGSQFRAIAGNARRNGVPSALGGPAKPPAPAPAPAKTGPTPPPATNEYGEEIPF